MGPLDEIQVRPSSLLQGQVGSSAQLRLLNAGDTQSNWETIIDCKTFDGLPAQIDINFMPFSPEAFTNTFPPVVPRDNFNYRIEYGAGTLGAFSTMTNLVTIPSGFPRRMQIRASWVRVSVQWTPVFGGPATTQGNAGAYASIGVGPVVWQRGQNVNNIGAGATADWAVAYFIPDFFKIWVAPQIITTPYTVSFISSTGGSTFLRSMPTGGVVEWPANPTTVLVRITNNDVAARSFSCAAVNQ